MMNTYHSLLLIIMLLSSACSVIPGQPAPPQQYDFGPLPESAGNDQATYDIRLGSISTATWMETNRIRYRLLYDQPSAYRTYSAHVWVAPPAELIALRINHLLFNQGKRNVGDTAKLRLDLVLDRFEQVFEGTRNAYVEARLLATLSNQKGQPVLRKEFHGRRQSSADVRGAIEALPLLADELIANLLDWIASLPDYAPETDNEPE